MVEINPRLVEPFVPDPQAIQRAQEQAEQLRAQINQRRAEQRPHRLAGLQQAGPSLRDLDAALDCPCACHPRPADLGLHDGGSSCGCQLSDDERRERSRGAMSALAELFQETREDDSSYTQVRDTATELGVEVTLAGFACPFVLTGTVDGRFGYLRERHGSYRICVAPDDDPLADVWRQNRDRGEIELATGSDDELTDMPTAVRLFVDAIRQYLTRRACAHDGALRFCPSCGQRQPA